MSLLPRGHAVKEDIDPGRVNLPEALEKLRSGTFTGYLNFAGRRERGILLFAQGRLTNALFEGERERLTAYDAIARIFERSIEGGMRLGIYRLSPELVRLLRGLQNGEVLYRGQALKFIDLERLLAIVREERLSGCLRVYSGERTALIFFREGLPIGFFHDGGQTLETQADLSRSVAGLPEAKLDVLSSGEGQGEDAGDLLDSPGMGALWQKALDMAVRQGRT
ncbi:MAG: hypothetical protein C0617_07215 [Desulfuromonas sp.]|uniref:hypothetical protein n=1 Tax=Desulfuromonas sp. TaxID=892 RepID=UPI000CA6837D|nr:hypothetical protein [Desulfuromonas sp.]PLX84621.1 MAG: hypothetical protein C0617_07215 [Desulfuromonas sp.]